MLHYNFPPFSVGEVGRFTGPGRREIGHGALAERSLFGMLPAEDKFPYTGPHRLRHPRVERIVVDGVGLRRIAGDDGRGRAAQVAGRGRRDGPPDGRAVGQVRRPQRHRRAPKITTATWTSRSPARATGITALQMDIKVGGITMEVMRKALEQAKDGRFFILGKMKAP
jgi:polyribonucleotide nucleotidyltransferase